MRKTKQRVTAATKLQAPTRGKRTRSQQKRQNKAATKLHVQALARGKRDRRVATVKKQQKQVRGRSAYKSYVSSFIVDTTDARSWRYSCTAILYSCTAVGSTAKI